VAQTLTAPIHQSLYYWKSEGKAEIDFLKVFNHGGVDFSSHKVKRAFWLKQPQCNSDNIEPNEFNISLKPLPSSSTSDNPWEKAAG
jgi:hypothetical protein